MKNQTGFEANRTTVQFCARKVSFHTENIQKGVVSLKIELFK